MSRYQAPVTCFYAKVAGVTYDNRQDAITTLGVLERLDLVPEPDNPHDSNAIKVCRRTGEQIGYLKRDRARKLVDKLKQGHRCLAFVKRVSGGETHYVSITVLVMAPGATDQQVADWINRYDVLHGLTLSVSAAGLVASPAVELVPDVSQPRPRRSGPPASLDVTPGAEPESTSPRSSRIWPVIVVVIAAAVLLALWLARPAGAHPGRLDRHGCHHEREAGEYHCHEGPLAGHTFKTQREMLRERARVAPPPAAVAPDKSALEARVVRIVDGDTIVVEIAGREERIRYIGMHTPKLRHPQRGEEARRRRGD